MGLSWESRVSKNAMSLRFLTVNLVNLIYRRIFHEEMSADVKTFIKNLSYVAVGTLVATLFYSFFTIFGGRVLGPEEYGKFGLVQSVSLLLCVPMGLGFEMAMLKYISENEDFERQSNIISSSCLMVILFSTTLIVIYLIFASQLARFLNIPENLFYFATAFSFLYVFYLLSTSTLRGTNRIRTYSLFQIVSSGIVLLAFTIFVLARQFIFQAMVYPMLFAYGISAVIIIFIVRKFIRWKFDILYVRKLFKYAWIAGLEGLFYVLFANADKLIINRYAAAVDVGVYNAYYMSSINVALVLWGAFNMVFFPTVSKYESKVAIFKRINKLVPHLIYIGVVFIFMSEFILLKVYGNEYPSNIFWMVLAAIASICFVIQNAYAWLLSSVGSSGVLISTYGAMSIAVVNISLNILLVPRIGIAGALISIIVSYIVGTITVLTLGRKYLSVQRRIKSDIAADS